MRFLKLTAAACAASLTSPALASEQDFNIWLGQIAAVEADENVTIRLEAQERYTDGASRLGQLLLRPAIGTQVSDDVSVFAGYAYVFTDPEGPASSNEHRIFQEVTIRLFHRDGTKITSRNRLEQRFFEEVDGMGLRYRNQIQLKTRISEKNSFVAYTEPFIELNESAVQNGGFRVWRNFVGVSAPIGDKLSLTPGYHNQYSFRAGEDRVQHIVNVTVSGQF